MELDIVGGLYHPCIDIVLQLLPLCISDCVGGSLLEDWNGNHHWVGILDGPRWQCQWKWNFNNKISLLDYQSSDWWHSMTSSHDRWWFGFCKPGQVLW